MATPNSSKSGKNSKLPVTSYADQMARRVISNQWRPDGMHRSMTWQDDVFLNHVQGGIDDQGGYDPRRFEPLHENLG